MRTGCRRARRVGRRRGSLEIFVENGHIGQALAVYLRHRRESDGRRVRGWPASLGYRDAPRWRSAPRTGVEGCPRPYVSSRALRRVSQSRSSAASAGLRASGSSSRAAARAIADAAMPMAPSPALPPRSSGDRVEDRVAYLVGEREVHLVRGLGDEREDHAGGRGEDLARRLPGRHAQATAAGGGLQGLDDHRVDVGDDAAGFAGARASVDQHVEVGVLKTETHMQVPAARMTSRGRRPPRTRLARRGIPRSRG